MSSSGRASSRLIASTEAVAVLNFSAWSSSSVFSAEATLRRVDLQELAVAVVEGVGLRRSRR